MDKTAKIVRELAKAGVEVYLSDEKLKAKALKGTLAPKYIELIKTNKPELIDYLNQQLTVELINKKPKIVSLDRSVDEFLPSFAQQRLWFIDKMDDGSAHYNMPSSVRLSGTFDLSAAEYSFNKIIERHEVLRTVFLEGKHGPVQRIQTQYKFSIEYKDLQNIPPADQKKAIHQAVKNDAEQTFDLSKDLMLRVSYLDLNDDEGIMLFNMHHIASDGWSIGVLFDEFVKLYKANLEGVQPSLEPLTIQYADFAHWQRNWLKGDVLEKQLLYWDKKLTDLPQVHSLPLDFERSKFQTFNGNEFEFSLSGQVLKDLKKIAHENQVTLFMVIHAAFSILLSRFSHTSDIVIGTPVANRTEKQLEPLIGFFANTLVLRADCSQDPTFIDFLSHIKNVNLEAQANQDVPFEHMVDRLNPNRSTNHNALFQIMLSMNNNESFDVGLPDVRIIPESKKQIVSKFDLTLNTLSDNNNLFCTFEYNIDLFKLKTIKQLANYFKTLLTSITLNQHQRITSLPIIEDKDATPLIEGLKGKKCDYPNNQCVHQLFESQVELSPDQIAVKYKEDSLTYVELNQQANRLAHYILTKKFEPDDIVGICLNRSTHLITAIIAVMKAGLAYLPLDPKQPSDRLDYMIKESGLKIVLTEDTLNNVLENELNNFPIVNPVNEKSSVNSLAYVIYTSGSTGKPKGVMVEHRAMVNFLMAMKEQLGQVLSSKTKCLAVTTVSFDIAGLELFGPLLFGGQVILATSQDTSNPNKLNELLNSHDVSLMQATPATWQMMVDSGWAGKPDLTILSGGEKLAIPLAKSLYSRCQEAWNCYGPTEATVWSMVRLIKKVSLKKNTIKLGGTLSNYSHYVLDENQSLVPFGAIGELCIGGDSLARGYLNQPQLTREKFIQNRFSNLQDARIYRTGDLVRYVSKNEVEFLGRLDDQVKIRGFRIELGEIESQLLLNPLVTSSVVLVKEDDVLENKQLVAYITSNSELEEPALKTTIIDFLKQHLPEYMLPSAVVCLEAMPLNSNGKIDRNALIQLKSISANETFINPINDIEKQLLRIWSELLNIPAEKISTNSNFFELGGHSLLSIRLIAEIRFQLQNEIDVRDIFEYPTISEMAAVISSVKNLIRPPIKKSKGERSLITASFAQQRLWFIDQMSEHGSVHYNLLSAIRLLGDFDINAANYALNCIIDRHESLRTVFVDSDEGLFQKICENNHLLIKQVDLSHLETGKQKQSIEQLIEDDSTKPFNLSNDLLLRSSYLKISQDEGVMIFNIHHIASDGWSMRVLTDEFIQLYSTYIEGKPNPLQPLTIQYADFAHWQHQWLSGEVLESQLLYWEKQLDGLPEVHNLPLDFERPQYPSYSGAVYDFKVSQETFKKLETIAKENNATLFMVIHAAFSLLLSRFSNDEDIVIGTPVANRPQKELEQLIGVFVNTLVLRTQCSANPSFIKYLKQVKSINLDAQANQDVPFEYLVDRLNPSRITGHNALIQIILNMDTHVNSELSLPNVRIIPEHKKQTTTKFDLQLNVSPSVNILGDTDDGDLNCSFQYSTDLFKPETISRFADGMRLILDTISIDPEQNISDLSVLSQKETEYLLYGLNDTKNNYANDLCIHQLFEIQVEKTPQYIAVADESQELSYIDLNVKANQLAHYLVSLNIKPGNIVGLCLHRSLDMMVGIMATLKAGAAYLPLDPTYPEGRLKHMVDDSSLTIILTQLNLSDVTSTFSQKQLFLDCNSFVQNLKKLPVSNPQIEDLNSKSLVYAIYTSGSTGKPKGVMVEHQALSNLCHWHIETYGVTDQVRASHLANIGFDAAVWEIWPYIVIGARIQVISDQTRISPKELLSQLSQYKVSHCFLPTALLEASFDLFDNTTSHSLKYILTGGEKLIQTHFSNAKTHLVNHYGPTESTVVTTQYVTNPDDEEAPPIGKPISNVKNYILDKNLNLTPYKTIGELYIGGKGLARGYLNQQRLTDDSFIPHRFNDDHVERLYKTGDLVRYAKGENIQFIGRIDDQVKIRGFRIELGEIESQIMALNIVQSSLVVIDQNEQNVQKLIAYICLKSDENETTLISNIRQSLARYLPDYMIPSVFIQVDKFPLTKNGKIDRNALPKPDLSALGGLYIAPEGETEQKLAHIWSELLDLSVNDISAEANFFDLGGHSLLSIRLLSEVRSTFGCELHIRDIFDMPKLRELSKKLKNAKSVGRLEMIKVDRTQDNLLSSFAQQRLWFIDQMDAGSIHYNIPSVIRLTGKFKVDIASLVFKEIIARHEILRTVFRDGDDGPVQIIKQNFEFNLKQTDISTFSSDVQSEIVNKTIEDDAKLAFDLSQDLMLRVSYIKVSDNEGVMLFNMHHIASDGWSIGVLIDEFSKRYRSLIELTANPLKPLSIQYADYAYWQRQWLNSEASEAQLCYWEKQLNNLPQVHSLPLDFERPQIQTYNGAKHNFKLDLIVLEKLKLIADKNQLTFFMLIHAAFSILLSRYSNNDDIVIGTPVANRLQKELEPLIGFFINTLVLRADCSDNVSFVDFLATIKDINLDAQANQDIPFEYLVDRLNPQRTTNYNALFQVMLSINNNKSFDLNLPDVTFSPIRSDSSIAKFDLLLDVLPVYCDSKNKEKNGEYGLYCSFDYNVNLFKPETVARLAESMQALLEGIADNQFQKISNLPLLSKSASNHILYELNKTKTDFPSHLCLHHLFEQQVKETPNFIAVIFENESLTYAELNKKANYLSHYLIENKIKADDIVGICVDRSLEMIIGILAILKSGAAYLPIDPSNPVERTKHTIQEAELSLILTQQHLIDEMSYDNIKLLPLNDPGFNKKIENHSEKNPQLNYLTPSNLAYVIYTSGSSGLPKGVMIEHRSAVNSVIARKNYYGTPVKKLLLIPPITFDISVAGVMWTLISGGQLVISPQKSISDTVYLIDLINNKKISHLLLTPTLLDVLLSQIQLEDCQSLEVVVTGGEAFSTNLPKLHQNVLPQTRLYNEYGPTESSVWVTAAELITKFNDDKENSKEISIGKPISNVRLFVLGKNREPLTFGSIGELYIGGEGLARGYLNQPELTSEKFINCNLGEGIAERLYKTGDLVRYISNDELTFVDRVDQQIKIRGFRIELSEIEQQLQRHDIIHSSLVILNENEIGEKKLVAYLKTDVLTNPEAFKESVRAHLNKYLPAYMVPSIFVFVEKFPVNANGKIDRKALPKPNLKMLSEVHIPPKGETEKSLARIWSDLLNVSLSEISADDNFFDLGGHSLLSIRLVASVRSVLDCELSVSEIFDSPQLSRLAKVISGSVKKARTKIIAKKRSSDHVITSYAQQRLWFIDQMEGGNSVQYNMPLAMYLTGAFNIEVAEVALNQIIARHETLRTVFVDGDDGPLQFIRQAFEFNINLINLTNLNIDKKNEEIKKTIDADAILPFDLSCDLMLRASFLQINDQEGVMLLNMHHIISDGWSIGVFIKEFTAIYQSIINGEESPLKPLPIQYADYAEWQRQSLKEETLETQFSYWDKQLANLPQVHSLPLDFERPQYQSFNGCKHQIKLSMSILEQLKLLSANNDITLFMLVHATFSILLTRYSNETDIVIGTPVANRLQNELEPLIGFFVNTLVLRTDSSNNLSFLDYLNDIRKVNLDAQTNQDIPFEHLVDRINPIRSTDYNSLFQIMLNMNSNDSVEMTLPGVEIKPLSGDRLVVKFDLMLSVFPAEDGLYCTFEYNTDLFKLQSIEKLADGLVNLFHSIVQSPNQSIGELSVINKNDESCFLNDLNDTEITYPSDVCIHQLFEQQVKETPDHIALIYKNESLTYSELNNRANQLAHYLISNGLSCDEIVGLCAERSLEMMIGILAIHKAGGAYLPLDPSFPQGRLDHMVSDSGLFFVLMQKHLSGRCGGEKQLFLDDPTFVNELADKPTTNPQIETLNSRQLAYVIYTSGSTGLPKGVMVEHQALVNRIDWMQKTYNLTETDVVLQKTPYSFDVSVWELTWFYTVGAKLVIAAPDGHKDPEYLSNLIQQHQITTLHFVPSMLRSMLLNSSWQDCVSLHQVFCSGEALPVDLPGIHYEMNKAKLHNLYGPTEAAIDVSYWEVPDQSNLSKVPIGKPIQNIQLYIMNEQLQFQPQGAPGELFIAGVGLARGYLNQAELTDEKFIEKKVGGVRQRLYRTGDLVRYLDDGNIEFLGRIDHQIKLRGLRIELGEIESQLSLVDEIDASVVVLKGKGVNQQLVAYFTSDSEEDESSLIDKITQSIKAHLPEYMVPSYFMCIEHIPLSANGKIDRSLLPEINIISAPKKYLAPSNDKEIILVDVISKELNLKKEQISMNDSFFNLGGNSLNILSIINKLKSKKIKNNIKLFYESETLREIAQNNSSSESIPAASCLIKLNSSSEGTPLYLIHPMGGRVDCYSDLALLLEGISPVYGIQAPFIEGESFEFDEMNQLAEYYASAIIYNQPEGPYRLGGWSIGGLIAQQITDVLSKAGKRVEYFIGIDSFMVMVNKQQSKEFEALKKVVAFIKGEKILDSEFYSQEIVNKSINKQLEYTVDKLFGTKELSWDKKQIETALKFGINIFKAKILINPQNNIKSTRLFVAEESDKKQLLLDGWNKGFETKTNFESLNGGHMDVFELSNLKILNEVISKDIKILEE